MTLTVAKLLADDTRAAICAALLDGRAWTAGELARHAGVAASTATEHLSLLVAGGLLVQERQGRHRYVRLSGAPAAELLERLTAFAPPPPSAAGSLRQHRADRALAFARTCYDHLAGTLGVAVTDALAGRGVLDVDLALTADGRAWFGTVLGDDLARPTRRPLSRPCLDWTERRPHLAGVAGQAVLRYLTGRAWLVPVGATRALRLTPEGGDGVREVFGLTFPEPLSTAGGRP
ncbi:ArsR/SmtB family transcription factor [Actinomadura flavalba]|uniref:ArsR/SmtB family transcription factor n=1 Tax=Actinomadura flavalba TaxID=1120938 RepID=UPI000370A56A|nr:winged helix-turn-helix domain-containing protein [Actinomadura flavalba]